MTSTPDMLLLEPVALLRRTVALTARSLGVATIHEAASHASAVALLKGRAFDGAVIAIDSSDGEVAFALLDEVRGGATASARTLPIAVMVEQIDTGLLNCLRERGVQHILVKPFRARKLIDTFTELGRKT